MLGAIVYILQAEEDGWLPEFTGRIMHGAMFQILKEKSQELAAMQTIIWIRAKR